MFCPTTSCNEKIDFNNQESYEKGIEWFNLNPKGRIAQSLLGNNKVDVVYLQSKGSKFDDSIQHMLHIVGPVCTSYEECIDYIYMNFGPLDANFVQGCIGPESDFRVFPELYNQVPSIQINLLLNSGGSDQDSESTAR